MGPASRRSGVARTGGTPVPPTAHLCCVEPLPLFVKQTGEKLARALKLKSKKGGDAAEWPEELRVRQFPLPVV